MTAVHTLYDEDGSATVVIDRPPVNALDLPTLEELHGEFAELRRRDDLAVLVLTAAGERAFCAGADVRETLTEAEADYRAELWVSILERLTSLEMPVVAAVNGACLGSGIGLITHTDLRIAVDRATFGLPEIDVGRSGGAAHLRRLTREGTVRRMMLTGKPLSAREAQRVGLVDYLVGESDWPQAVDRLRRELALATAALLREAKKLLNESWALSYRHTPADGALETAAGQRRGSLGLGHSQQKMRFR
jgi:enoyl-CoA hydratase